jgi:hypothetical protein
MVSAARFPPDRARYRYRARSLFVIVLPGDRLCPSDRKSRTRTITSTRTIEEVEVRGFEPLTFSLRTRRSTN